jgi:hypothetical protein
MQELFHFNEPLIATKRVIVGVVLAGILGLLIGMALGLCYMMVTGTYHFVVLWKIIVVGTLGGAAIGISLHY